MIAAFAYLISRSTRNRFIAQVKRVKKPRYAIALLFGLAYLGVFIFGQIFARSHAPSGVRSSLIGGNAEAIAPLGIAIVLASVWIFGSDLSALAFSQAEVAMLFTAPVARRTLIIYKLVRMQLGVLFSAAIWVLILGRGGSAIPKWAMLVACYSLFATLGLHRLGTALVLAKREVRAKEGSGRNWFVLVMTLVFVLVMMSQIIPPSGAGGESPFAFVDGIARALSTPTMRTLFYPFHLMMAPMFAVSVGAWASALWPAVAILALHVWWVLRMDTAFEEAAAIASERRAKLIESMRARRSGFPAPKAADAKRTIKLASSGRPGAAILWKNMLALKRQWTMSTLARPVIIALFLSYTVFRTMHDPAKIVAVVAGYLAFMLTLVGGQSLRNDLRSDMLHLPFLKALPLSGADIVLAEVASSTLPLAAIQLTLVVIAVVALGFSTGPEIIPTAIRVGMLLAAPFVLVTVNGAMLGVSNGMAVLFPGWMRLGPTGAGGFEVIGQAMLSMFAMFLGFVLLLALPSVGGGAVFWALSATPSVATVAAGLSGAMLLAGEVYAMILLLGRAFERAEPQQVT